MCLWLADTRGRRTRMQDSHQPATFAPILLQHCSNLNDQVQISQPPLHLPAIGWSAIKHAKDIAWLCFVVGHGNPDDRSAYKGLKVRLITRTGSLLQFHPSAPLTAAKYAVVSQRCRKHPDRHSPPARQALGTPPPVFRFLKPRGGISSFALMAPVIHLAGPMPTPML